MLPEYQELTEEAQKEPCRTCGKPLGNCVYSQCHACFMKDEHWHNPALNKKAPKEV